MADAIMNPRARRGYVFRGSLYLEPSGPDAAANDGMAPGDDDAPDLSETLHDFGNALCFLGVPLRSIEGDDDKQNPVYEELVCMRHGLDRLNKIYTNFDKGISALNRARRERADSDEDDDPETDED